MIEHELRSTTLGVYQLKMGHSYTKEHIKGGDYVIMMDVGTEVANASRHTRSRKYLLWIQYDAFRIITLYCQFLALWVGR